MTQPRDPSASLQAFEQLLATHGSDRTRWPAHSRLMFAGLIATDPKAQRLLEEAEALDRLLDQAPPHTQRDGTSALADRILARALQDIAPVQAHKARQAREARAPTNASAATAPPRVLQPAKGTSRTSVRELWPAAAVLAASLVFGTTAGSYGLVDQLLSPAFAAASLHQTDDPEGAQLNQDGLSIFEDVT